MLNDCLQVQQMQLEQMQQTPPETVDMRGLVTGPTTDLYSGKINEDVVSYWPIKHLNSSGEISDPIKFFYEWNLVSNWLVKLIWILKILSLFDQINSLKTKIKSLND